MSDKDTIYRQAAIDAARKCPVKEVTPAYMLINKAEVMTELMMLPPAQPKKGEWLPDNTNYYEERFVCSVCRKSYEVDTCMGEPTWDFCPGCGADMRGEEQDATDGPHCGHGGTK